MTEAEQEKIAGMIHATAEVLGHEIKPAAAAMMACDLSGYQTGAVVEALARCRRELTGRLALAHIIERIQTADGRPTANEAWALALKSMDEADTVILNDEIAESLNFARDIFLSGDEIGARMAFRDSYERISKQARAEGKPVKWWPSLGHDPQRRDAAIEQAVVTGLLPRSHMDALPSPGKSCFAGLIENASHGVSEDEADSRIAALKSLLGVEKERRQMTRAEQDERRSYLLKQASEIRGSL